MKQVAQLSWVCRTSFSERVELGKDLKERENLSDLSPNIQVLELVKLDIILGAGFCFTASSREIFGVSQNCAQTLYWSASAGATNNPKFSVV